MKKIRVLFVSLISMILLTTNIFAAATVEWKYNYGRAGQCVILTTDGSFVIATDAGNLIKTDSDGNEIWNKPFEDPTVMLRVDLSS